jgi:hypothetical protein
MHFVQWSDSVSAVTFIVGTSGGPLYRNAKCRNSWEAP